METALYLLEVMPTFGVMILLLVAARYLFISTTPFRSVSSILDDENSATGVVFGAFLIAVAIALAGTAFGREQEDALVRVAKSAVEGALAITLIRVSIWVNDRFILYRFCIAKEINEDKNLGAGFCVAGSCIACGFILNGALTGFSSDFLHGLRDVVIYWSLGQVALVLGAFIYQRIKKHDVHRLIEYDDNVAVGIGFGAFLASLGLVVRASLVGAGLDSMVHELPRTLICAWIGITGVIAVNVIATLFVRAKTSYEDEVEMHGNVAMSAATACASLAMAIVFASLIQR